MLNSSGKFLIFFLIAAILTSGCIHQTTPDASVVAPTITISTPTTAFSPVIPDTVIPTTSAVTPTTSFVPIKTLFSEADPTDISKITFLHYSDGDFSMDYPSTWTITPSDHTPYPVGPFYLYDDPRLNAPYRVVTFTSPDKTKKFVALTQDFSQAGRFVLNPTLDWAKAMFEKNYPDLSPLNYLGNYKYFSSGNTMASTYDVTLPKGSRYYPSAYSIKTIITTRHVYNFGFFTDTENFTAYQNLKERILSSITTNNG
jgi:hypothetical protein